MRRFAFLAVVVPVTVLLPGCGRAPRTVASSSVDLQRDLKLAAMPTIDLVSPRVNPANFKDLETAPQSQLRPAKRLVRAPGPEAVSSTTPDLEASRIPQVAASEPIPQVRTVAPAPLPTFGQDPVATLPRGGAAAGASTDNGQGSAGSGSGIGPIIGVIIRGGDVGGDNCEPHRGRGPLPGVYIPEPGGFGGARFPVVPSGGSVIH